ncbi:MAG: hypothetical protein MO853_10055 [Candidatus Protistobacter heckmanni]|nr:hypothetical protein [Candidatus Protistobacter heckmanni]
MSIILLHAVSYAVTLSCQAALLPGKVALLSSPVLESDLRLVLSELSKPGARAGRGFRRAVRGPGAGTDHGSEGPAAARRRRHQS